MEPLQRVGRHSLAAYLLHQPVLLAILALVTGTVIPPSASRDQDQTATNVFLEQCEETCHAAATDLAVCRSACRCALTAAMNSSQPEAAKLALSCTGPRKPPNTQE